MQVSIKNILSFSPPQSVEVMVGSTVLGQGTYYKAQQFIKHERYNNPDFANDIALILVQGSIQFNQNVRPISYSSRDVSPGAHVIATGWGLTSVSTSTWKQMNARKYFHIIRINYKIVCISFNT